MSGRAEVGPLAGAIIARIKEGGSCVLEGFGKDSSVLSLQVRQRGVGRE